MNRNTASHTLEFEIPAGASTVSVQLLSEDRGGVNTGRGLASFLWVYSGLSVSGDGGATEFGCDPHFWACNWWRWDPWCRYNNTTDEIQWSDRFNQTFDVTRYESGLPNGARLIHGLYGYGNCDDWARRMLNREIAAALANADSDINYPLSVDEVIALYRDAVDADEGSETVQSALETVYQANRLGCPW